MTTRTARELQIAHVELLADLLRQVDNRFADVGACPDYLPASPAMTWHANHIDAGRGVVPNWSDLPPTTTVGQVRRYLDRVLDRRGWVLAELPEHGGIVVADRP
jgi:hypothetical protein